MRAYAYERKGRKTWYKYLPQVQRILNASTHKSIGVSPAQIIVYNDVQLDRQLPLAESTSSSTRKTYKEHLEDMLNAQSEILKLANKTQKKLMTFK